MKLKLAASEHRTVGPALVILTRSVQSAGVLNEFKRSPDILRRLRRAARELEKLRCKLDSLMAEQHPAEFHPSTAPATASILEAMCMSAAAIA